MLKITKLYSFLCFIVNCFSINGNFFIFARSMILSDISEHFPKPKYNQKKKRTIVLQVQTLHLTILRKELHILAVDLERQEKITFKNKDDWKVSKKQNKYIFL